MSEFNKPTIAEQIDYIHEWRTTMASDADIIEASTEDIALDEKEFFVNHLRSEAEMLKAIEENLLVIRMMDNDPSIRINPNPIAPPSLDGFIVTPLNNN